MATGNAVLKTLPGFLTTTCVSTFCVKKSIKLPLIRHRTFQSIYYLNTTFVQFPTRSFDKFVSFSADAETVQPLTEQHDSIIEGNTDSDNGVNSSTENVSAVLASLSVYKEALTNNDESKIVEVESFLKSVETEKIELGQKLEMLLEELLNKKAGILTISAEFNNFRKRTEMERMSLVADARGQVLESMLPVVDDFERVTAQIKVEKEGEERINISYLSIYKQFVEILGSLHDDPVKTIAEPSDPLMVSTQDGSRFSRTINEIRQRLNRVYLEFTKTWIRF